MHRHVFTTIKSRNKIVPGTSQPYHIWGSEASKRLGYYIETTCRQKLNVRFSRQRSCVLGNPTSWTKSTHSHRWYYCPRIVTGSSSDTAKFTHGEYACQLTTVCTANSKGQPTPPTTKLISRFHRTDKIWWY